MQVCKYASLQVCKYASMQICKYEHICKYVSMQVCSYMQWFSENSLPYSNLLYPTYPTNKSEAIYMSAVAAFFECNLILTLPLSSWPTCAIEWAARRRK